MSESTPSPDPNSPVHHTTPAAQEDVSKRSLLIEALVIFAISAGLTRILSDLASISALVSEYLFTLVAAVFLGIPYFWITRKKRSFETHALTWTGWPRAVALGLLLAVVTAVPFFAGYHLWRTEVLGHTFHFSLENYQQLPALLEGKPPNLAQKSTEPEVFLWRDGRLLFVQWNAGQGRHQLQLDLTSSDGGEFTVHQGRSWVKDLSVRRTGGPVPSLSFSTTTKAPTLRRATLQLKGGSDLTIDIKRDGKSITTQALRLGGARVTPEQIGEVRKGTLVLSRGISWLPLIVLAQLLLIALPEEYFYRGYLQTTLARVWPQQWNILWLHTGPAILLTSLLFGVGHFIIDIRPARMSVFFPSLLFGWLRDRSGTIASCVVYHACCNLLVEAATHHYF